MITKTIFFGDYKKVLFRGKDGLWYVREYTCTSRRRGCVDCGDYTNCGQKPEGIGPLVAFAMMVILLFVLMYSLMYLETIVPY